jgi:hypothetical protein
VASAQLLRRFRRRMDIRRLMISTAPPTVLQM